MDRNCSQRSKLANSSNESRNRRSAAKSRFRSSSVDLRHKISLHLFNGFVEQGICNHLDFFTITKRSNYRVGVGLFARVNTSLSWEAHFAAEMRRMAAVQRHTEYRRKTRQQYLQENPSTLGSCHRHRKACARKTFVCDDSRGCGRRRRRGQAGAFREATS